MDFNLYFDIAAIVIFIVLIFAAVLKRQLIGLSNKLFIVSIALALATAVFDILASLPMFDVATLFALNTVFMLVRSAMTVSVFFYATNLGRALVYMKRHGWLFPLVMTPFFVLVIMFVVNAFTKQIFDYLPGPEYRRGGLIWIPYFVGYLYAFSGLVFVVLGRKYHSASQTIAVISVFILQIAASVFQLFSNAVLIEMFVAAITFFMLSLFLESPENFVDAKTKDRNYTSFESNMKQKFDFRDNFSILLVHAMNSSALYNLYQPKKAIGFIRACNAMLRGKIMAIEKSCVVYYLGDATFACCYDKKASDQAIFDTVRQTFSSPMMNNGISFQFIAKLCLVHCPEDCKDVDSLLAFSTLFYELTDSDVLDLEPYRSSSGNVLFELDHLLEKAIREESFSLYYQPIYSIKQKRFTCAEALLRLHDSTFGLLMPGLIIPYAEKRGKMVAIGRIVLKRAFAFYAKELKETLDYLEVNLSPLQLQDPYLSQDILALASQFDIEPSDIVFEITESSSIGENPVVGENLDSLSNAGFRIAIDDFGTGYSNFARIIHLNVCTLKFDKSMTDAFDVGDQDDLYRGLFSLFRGRGIKMLFEGVERQETVDKLSKAEADEVQGFYFSKPIPEVEFLNFIRTKNKPE